MKSWQCIQEKVECIDYEKILKFIVTIHWISRKVKKKSHQYYPLIHRDYVEIIVIVSFNYLDSCQISRLMQSQSKLTREI